MGRDSEPLSLADAPAAKRPRYEVWKRQARRLAFLVSLLLWLFLAVCYAARPDRCAAVTVWPVWIWTLPGLLFATLACERNPYRPLMLGTLLWLLFTLLFAEEPRSLARSLLPLSREWQEARRRNQAIRIVSINCAWGQKDAALEAAAFQPDIVLLQETPPRRKVEEVARTLFGKEAGVLAGIDAALMVRGKLTPTRLPRRTGFFTQARVRLSTGQEIEVFSVHVSVPPFRTDLWNPDCWRAYHAHRAHQRTQMRVIARQMAAVPDGVPVIVGGDFNAPQGDAIFRLLEPRLHDTFAAAGRGWGNTIVNEYPALRIDQIWTSRHFRATNVFARRTRYSDHRMAVCDVVMVEP